MKSINFTPPPDKKIARILDANLDRAREGLRVIEDWCRFGIDRKDLVIKLKDWRHQLSIHHHEIYKQARSANTDQGALLEHPAQKNRKSSTQIIFANCSRIQEALRVLEEFSRNSDPALAKTASIIRFEIYEFELTVLKANTKNKKIKLLADCNLCLITSPHKELIKTVSSALTAGVKMVQYRCKASNDQRKLKEAKELASICKKNNALFIINDRIDLAIAVDADGIHLGQEDIPSETARKILGEERLIGKSTHSLIQIKQAEDEDCDYIGFGPIFSTKNKPKAETLGIKSLSEIYLKTRLPCFAIGGINISNIDQVISSGFKRIAVIDAIMNAKDPNFAANNLLKELS
tara:strand:+ start:2593 stop:3639 length:1047 start_codon:yes stop_codon:yes gene_type:complete